MGKIANEYVEWYMTRLYDTIYGSEYWKYAHHGREEPHTLYRHVVRYFMKQDTNATLEQIGKIEGDLFGKKPVGHSTILHSVRTVKDDVIDKQIFIEGQDARAKVQREYEELAKKHRLQDAISVFFTQPLKDQFELLNEFLKNNDRAGQEFTDFINSHENLNKNQ